MHLFASNHTGTNTTEEPASFSGSYPAALFTYFIPWLGLVIMYCIFVPTCAGYEFDESGSPVTNSFVQQYPAASETMLTIGFSLFVVMALVGGYFRGQLRNRLDIAGVACEDYCCHFLCCCCAIAQETRAVRVWKKEQHEHEHINQKLHSEETPLMKGEGV